MANTVIQLKWSSVNAAPPSLNTAEPAYSYISDKFFIGNSAGNGVIEIGGKYYTDIISAATNASTANTLVKRDASGNFSAGTITAALSGNATSADKWSTARNIGVSGEATGIVSVDGSANANIPVTLSATGVTAGTYGSSTIVPVFNVAANGRILSASNVAISLSSSLSIAGDSGTDTVTVGTNTLTFEGGDGVTTTVTDNKVSVAVDNTVVRTSGSQSITGDLTVSGNLVILGNTVTQDVETIRTEDTLLELAANNSGDVLDIGFFGSYNGTTYTAFFRDASDSGKFKLLTAGTDKPSVGNTVNTAAFTTGTLVTNITGGTVSSLASAIAVGDGGTGATTFTAGGILIGNGTGAVSSLANTTFTATNLGAANTINSVTVDDYGRTTAVSTTPIAIGAGQITSGTLGISRGGTNQTTFTTGQRILFDGTSLASQANTSTTVTGGLAAGNTITSITTNSYGEITAYTGAEIAIGAGQITSGTLGVTRGGTGASTLTANAVVIGQGTSAVTTVGSSTEGHILTINASGVPQFMYLSGGTF